MVGQYQQILKRVSINLDIPLEEITEVFEEYCKDLEDNIRLFAQPEYDYFGIGKITTGLPKLRDQIDSIFFDESKKENAEIVYNKVKTIYDLDREAIAHAAFNFTKEGLPDGGVLHRKKKEDILKYLKENGESSISQLCKGLGYSLKENLIYEVNVLKKEGKIKMLGNTKAVKYKLI